MKAHHIVNPRDGAQPWQSLEELQAILARYRADDSSWPRGLLNLQVAIRAKVAMRAEG